MSSLVKKNGIDTVDKVWKLAWWFREDPRLNGLFEDDQATSSDPFPDLGIVLRKLIEDAFSALN
jgi:hypothetical protein